MTDQQNTEAAQGQGPQFSLQRIYVRDLSFEAPKSPAIFRQEWTPSVALDLNTRQKALEGDFHEVVLTLSVTVKNGEEVAFDEIKVDGKPQVRAEMTKKAGRTSVPQIWIGDTHIGGCDDLFALERGGKLDALLA